MRKEIHSNLSKFDFKFVIFGIFFTAFAFFIAIVVYFKYTQEDYAKTAFSSQASIKGEALVIDGDSISISSVMIRLAGIDAPELNQFCGVEEASYPCGVESKKYLESLTENQQIICYWNKKDKYHRILATCKTNKVENINAKIVQNGWAVSYHDYPKEEEEAKKEKKGIWKSSFQYPREWRRSHPREN
ncbi:thermonuclease family protein [Bartonella sp. B41]